ncbi:MAG: ABC-2 transporter permease [Ruminococcus sp.]|uniref:ABC-2 transporter permease n=1 Tax=Ruminococcus sp. TaxID=41978 RepID=UPI0025CBBC67|nr:ABC-2 transporter permease [Ruminococcus sp.]MBO4867086.1 ABC-2 transporter permease [Ruminococcus sp.]
MKGLLEKEKISMINICKVFLLIPLIFYAALIYGTVIKGHSSLDGYPLGLVFIMMGIMPIAVINQETQSKWHVNVLTMPFTRSQIVSVKYIAVLIINLLTAIVSAAVITFCSVYGADTNGINAVVTANMLFGGLGIGLMPSVIFFPLCFRFYNSVGGIKTILGALVGGFMGGSNMVIMEQVMKSKGIFGGGFIFICVMLVLFFVSWGLSILIFRKRDV